MSGPAASDTDRDIRPAGLGAVVKALTVEAATRAGDIQAHRTARPANMDSRR